MENLERMVAQEAGQPSPACGFADGFPKFRQEANPVTGGMKHQYRCCYAPECAYQFLDDGWPYCRYALGESVALVEISLPERDGAADEHTLKYCA